MKWQMLSSICCFLSILLNAKPIVNKRIAVSLRNIKFKKKMNYLLYTFGKKKIKCKCKIRILNNSIISFLYYRIKLNIHSKAKKMTQMLNKVIARDCFLHLLRPFLVLFLLYKEAFL